MHNKKRLTHLAATALLGSLAANAYAVSPGLYVGLMAGPSTNNGSEVQVRVQNPPPKNTTATPQSNQFGVRGFVGYKASDYFAFETGIVYFSTINYSVPKGQDVGSTKAGVAAWDLLGVGTYSFSNTFDIMGKFGLGVIYQGVSRTLVQPPAGDSKYKVYARPAYGFGVGYNLNQNWMLEFSLTRYMTGGVVKNMDLFGLGLTFHIVDTFCGQFLCDD